MQIINLSEKSSLLNKFVAEIRDVNIQKDRLRFRRNLERVGEIMAYEISKTMSHEEKTVTTPLGRAIVTVPCEKVVLGTILRAGMPFHGGFLSYFDESENAFVSAFREYSDAEHFVIRTEYIASPKVDGKTLLMIDPMLATGSSMDTCYHSILAKGTPAKLHIACVIASEPALEYIRHRLPEHTVVWCAAIDPAINAHAYIVPGLGDAGDLAYGIKD